LKETRNDGNANAAERLVSAYETIAAFHPCGAQMGLVIRPIAFVPLLFATAAIVFFCGGNNNAVFALSRAFAIPSIAALVCSVKNTRKG
jgi:hypothetical protein